MHLFKVIFEIDNIVDTMEVEAYSLEMAYELVNTNFPSLMVDHIMPIII